MGPIEVLDRSTTLSARFAGVGAGGGAWDGPATWGQRAFADGLRRYGEAGWYRSAVPVWQVPPGTRMPTVLAVLGRVVSRYEGLRTTLVDTPDGPRQQLLGHGEFPVEVVEAGADPDTVIADVVARLRGIECGAPGLPFACAVVTQAGRPCAVVASISHLAVDASGVRLLLAHRPGQQSGRPLQPRELVALENEAGYRRRSERAVAGWRAAVAETDLPFAHPRTDPLAAQSDTDIRQAALTSAAAAARLAALAERTGLNSSAVLLAAVAVALGGALGRRQVPLQLVTSNRHLPAVSDYLGVLAQLAPLVADVDPALPFAALAARLQEQSMRSFRSALWSPAELDAALLADGRSPAEVLGATCTFNDARGGWPRAGTDAPDPGRDYALRPLPGWPYQGGRLAVAAAGGPELLTLSLRADTRFVDPDHFAHLLPAIDAVLRRAHDDGPQTGVARLAGAAD